jgi:hypothetical protein
MSNIDDYNAKLDVLKAIPIEEILTPTLPVDVFLQEAENLFHWSDDDKAELTGVGVSEDDINDLPVRAGALREAQSLWFKDRYSQQEAQREWATLSPQAYDLRDDLLHAFRFAYRDDAVILSRVSAIAEGTGHADMIQDLNDLAVLGRENPDALTAIGFDGAKLDAAATKADEMADLLATANGDKAEQNASKVTRDRAYTHLKALVDEIRGAGKYLFWKNPQRLKGYSSQYWKKQNRKNDDKTTEVFD